MRISYNWLKKYIDFDLTSEQLADYLTFAGIEVEEVIQIGTELQQILVAEIVEKKPHPDAEKLSVCTVNDGETNLQIVCGAPNCTVNQKIALAPVGSSVGDFKIKKAKLRGVASFGMLCSEKELGISENHDGIMVLDEDAPVGSSLMDYLKIKDTVYDVEITPNRPDLLGNFGVARDLSALLNVKLRLPETEFTEIKKSIGQMLELENQAPELCPRYTVRIIENVQIKESPKWLKKILLAVGLRPINNVVDVTNYVMMEMGHPLHAFDYSFLEGNKIIIRRSNEGEKFPALDEETYSLKNTDLVIADNKKPVALAGIIGGLNSHITESTSTVVLEAANFTYSSIRKTAGKFNISTDSSYRFERNLPEETVDSVSRRAAFLIQKLAGGEILQGKLDSYPMKQEKLTVKLRPSRVSLLLGFDIPNKKIIQYLEALSLKLLDTSEEFLLFEIPSFRKDLSREVDLIEEIIRLHGYNNVGSNLKIQSIMNREAIFTRRNIKQSFVNYGMSELINWSFGDPEDLDKLLIESDDKRKKNVKLLNPLGTSFSIMRSSLLPALLRNAQFNLNHSQKNIKTFELAKVYFREDQKLAEEEYIAAGLIIGDVQEIFWGEKSREIDFYDLKGLLNNIFDNLDLHDLEYAESIDPYYQSGLAADVIYKGTKIASLGKLDPKVALKFGVERITYTFEIMIGRILKQHARKLPVFKDIPKFPPVLRDLSFIISKQYNLSEIETAIKKTNQKLIKKVVLFDEYKGKNIDSDKRSLSFSLIFNSPTKTLTDEFINNIISKIIKNLEREFAIALR